MTNRVQTLRSSTTGNVPAAGTRAPGELWTNFADLQIGVIDASKNAQKLVAVRYFSASANYVTGDFVVQAGVIYSANGAITAGAFNSTQWTALATANSVPIPAAGIPLVDGGTGSAGSANSFSRGDHQHPTDTSRYAASNPSGFQTAGQVTASLTSYLPLAGGVLTGTLTPAAAGIVGVTDASIAPAGAVGEVLITSVTTPVSVPTGPATTVGTLTMTPGDWDISGEEQGARRPILIIGPPTVRCAGFVTCQRDGKRQQCRV